MKKSAGIALAFFLLVSVIFFYPTVLSGKIPVPIDSLVGLYHPWRDALADEYPRGVPFKNFLITDPVRQQIPWRKIAIDQWKQGVFPRWNPYNFSGTPLAANIQAGVFYPLNILFFMFDFISAWTVLVMLQPFLSGMFLFFYLRSLQRSVWASLFGSLAWSLSGFSIAWLTWGTIGHVVAWLPLMLLAVDRVLDGKNIFRWTLMLGGVMVMSFFAGHSQIFLYSVGVSLAYALYRINTVGHEQRKIARKWLLGGLFGAVGITAIQWIPMMSFLPQTTRLADLEGWKNAGWFIPWVHLIQFFAPDFFGNPATLNYWGEWNYGEFIGYIGLIPLFFALSAIKIQHRVLRFWTWVVGITFIFALPTFIAKLPFMLQIPIISTLQPTRLLSLAAFSLAILASFGFDEWLSGRKILLRSVRIFILIFVSLWSFVLIRSRTADGVSLENIAVSQNNLILPTGLFIFGSFLYFLGSIKRFQTVVAAALLVISLFDLLRFGWKFTPFVGREYFFPETKSIQFLQSQPGPFRIMSLDSRVLPPNTSAYFGLESIEGYDPIYDGSYEKFIVASERGSPNIFPPYGLNRIITPHNVDSPLIALLNVRYVLSLEELNRSFLKKVFQEGDTRVYEDTRTVPRAFFTEEVVYEKNRQAILERLFEKDFNPVKKAFIEEPVSIVPVPLKSNEFITVDSYTVNNLILQVQAQSDRFLMISNLYSSNQEAFIDGVKTRIYKANYLFQGVVVPLGNHTIVLR